jgi:hypothetical protein
MNKNANPRNRNFTNYSLISTFFCTSFGLFTFEDWCKCTFKSYQQNKFEEKKKFLVGILSATDEKAGTGSVSQLYESTDPYSYQNVTDPQC